MKLFLILSLVIIFIPIPIKISIYASTDDYYLKIYKFYILKRKKEKNIKTTNPVMKKANKRKKKKKPSLLKEISPKKVIKLLKLFNNNKFKPRLKVKGYFCYSLGDAAKTAIFYGVLSTYFPLLFFALNIIFKTKKFSLPINPIYEDKFIVKTEITSIITLSLAQIICINILVIKAINILKEVKLERDHI